ncbi:uncharacterized protein LOC132635641 [Lycium barbarum]|uniref:uncharacterized protein LOC132635641 n=1 Tax=Lycium barbarum TaxID=112863 RepID=UPI00293F12D8|nr:uncharacterized protein LOC132635641 [Lycium barbarum]XP_060208100.1 uncharacterized protein LOC132635641 [Lycium barbarum]
MENSATSVRTEAISIGLNLPMPVKEKGDCQHFSMRQYVADQMRKKDMQICSPFGSSSIVRAFVNPATKECSAREIELTDPVANLLNSSTKIAVTEPIPSNDGNDKVVPHDGIDSEIDPEKEKSSQNGQRTASNTSDQIEVLSGSKEKVLNMRSVMLRGSPSFGSRKGTDKSKGNDANLAENRLCDLHEDIASDLPPKKTKKTRLLTDLLRGNVNLEMSHANAERFLANTMPMLHSETDTVATPTDKVSILENVGKGIKISRKKRNMSQEDGSKSGMNLDGKMAKRLKALNQNQIAKRSPMEIKVTDSRRGENGSDRERLQSGSKSVKNKHISDKDSGVSRKKHKQAQVVGGYSLQMPLEKKNSTGIGTSGYGANILFHSSHASPSTGKVELRLRNNNESLRGKERDFGLSLNSNKLLEVRHASSRMNVVPDKNLRRDSVSKGEDVVQMPIGMGMVTPQPEKELSIKEKLDWSLSSFKGAQKHVGIGTVTPQPAKELSIKEKLDRSLSSIRGAQKHVENYPTQSKTTINWPLVLQKGNKSCDLLRSNMSESGQSSGKEVNSLVPNVFEPGHSLRKSLFRRPHVSETGGSLRKGVNPLVTQTNVPEARQTLRKGMIFDLNQGIAQTPPNCSSDLLQRGNFQIQNPMEMQFKLFGASTQIQQRLSNGLQVSALVPTRWGLQHGEGPKPVWFPAGQNISFGQPSGSVQKGRTISDIKTLESKSSNKTGNPGVGASNFKQRPFSPYINHPPIPYFNDQVSLQTQLQEEKRKPHATARLGGTKLRQSSGLLRTTRVPESRGIFGASSSKFVPLQDDNTYKSLNADGCSTRVAVLPVRRIFEKDPSCLFNQNPADIAHADDDTYMRTVADQRVHGKSALKEKTSQRRKERPGRLPLGCCAS